MPTSLQRIISVFDRTKVPASVSAIVGGTGIGVVFSSATGLAAALAVGAAVSGGVALLVIGGYAAYRGLRGRSRKAYSQKGLAQPIDGSSISSPYWSCYFSSVVIIGVEATGKTELKNYFRSYQPEVHKKTTDLEIHLIELDENPNRYAVFLDGQGATSKEANQQLEIIRKSRSIIKGSIVIIVMADHDPTKACEEGGNGTEVKEFTKARREQHEIFFKKARSFISSALSAEKKGLIFLMNKADLWQDGPHKDVINRWYEKEREIWEEVPVDKFESYIISAKRNDSENLQRVRRDINRFIEELEKDI